jgi:hypothetical protein
MLFPGRPRCSPSGRASGSIHHQVRTPIDEPFTRALLPPGDDEIHYALGFGVAFKAFQIDLGADFSDPRDTIALSAIYSF